jgi:hypothetical protein
MQINYYKTTRGSVVDERVETNEEHMQTIKGNAAGQNTKHEVPTVAPLMD